LRRHHALRHHRGRHHRGGEGNRLAGAAGRASVGDERRSRKKNSRRVRIEFDSRRRPCRRGGENREGDQEGLRPLGSLVMRVVLASLAVLSLSAGSAWAAAFDNYRAACLDSGGDLGKVRATAAARGWGKLTDADREV